MSNVLSVRHLPWRGLRIRLVNTEVIIASVQLSCMSTAYRYKYKVLPLCLYTGYLDRFSLPASLS